MHPNQAKQILLIAAVTITFFFVSKCFVTVEAGHVAVLTIFGEVDQTPRGPGFHLINPFCKVHYFDVQEDMIEQTADVPSQDQLRTEIDVSVKYKLIATETPRIHEETGDVREVQRVQILPAIRSQIRDLGKTVKNAEDFFQSGTRERLAAQLEKSLKVYLMPKGVIVLSVMIRRIELPKYITAEIERKKVQEQVAEKQKAELERFRTEQQQKIAQAEAEQKAAELDAKKQKILADAQAYEIKAINEAISDSPVYVQLKALDALKSISKDPSSKIYFINGDSPTPLPLMHMGERK